MPFTRFALAGLAVVSLGLGAARAETVRISYQPRETAIPFFIASERGFWAQLGIEPEISSFAAGPQQVAALASWDIGITGGPPAALGAARFGLRTIAIATDESAMNAMVVRNADLAEIQRDPRWMKGKQLLVSTNTTAEYSALACLRKLGLAQADVQEVNLGPAQLISAFSSGSGAVAVTWPPFVYALQDKGGITEVCSGREAGIVIPSTVVVRSDFAEKRPDLVAKVLAIYFHAAAWQRAHPEEAVAYIKKYNEKNGVILSTASNEKIYQRSITFSFPEELKMFDRKAGGSLADKWMSDLSAYLVGTGTLSAVQNPETYVDGRFLRAVQDDPKLRDFAMGEQ